MLWICSKSSKSHRAKTNTTVALCSPWDWSSPLSAKKSCNRQYGVPVDPKPDGPPLYRLQITTAELSVQNATQNNQHTIGLFSLITKNGQLRAHNWHLHDPRKEKTPSRHSLWRTFRRA